MPSANTKTLTPALSRRTGRGSKPAPLAIAVSAATGREHIAHLRRMLAKLAPHLRGNLREVSFALVGDATMSRLHVQFMDIAGPTDVLTFELDHDARGRVTAGEVVVCVPEARRQARRHGTDVRRELLLYCLHGLLHLTGYDDLDESSHRKMHREEDRILTAIGVGPVFHSSVPTATRKKSRSAR